MRAAVAPRTVAMSERALDWLAYIHWSSVTNRHVGHRAQPRDLTHELLTAGLIIERNQRQPVPGVPARCVLDVTAAGVRAVAHHTPLNRGWTR